MEFQATALIQTELTRCISCSDINIMSQNDIKALEVSPSCSQMKPEKGRSPHDCSKREKNKRGESVFIKTKLKHNQHFINCIY